MCSMEGEQVSISLDKDGKSLRAFQFNTLRLSLLPFRGGRILTQFFFRLLDDTHTHRANPPPPLFVLLEGGNNMQGL